MKKPRAVTVVKIVVAVAAVIFVAWMVPWNDKCPGGGAPCEAGLRTTLSHADSTILGALVLVYALGSLVWALRWYELVKLAGTPFTRLRAWRLVTEAQAGGLLLPGGVGGDALRVAAVAQDGTKLVLAAGTVLLDRGLGLATLGAVAGGLVLLQAGKLGTPELVVTGMPVGFALAIAAFRSRTVASASFLTNGRLARVTKPLLEYVGAPGAIRAIAAAALPSLASSAVHLTMLRGVVRALGCAPTSEREFFVCAALALACTALPAIPGGWGTSEAAFVVLLGRAGVPAPAAVSTALIYRMYWYAYGLVGAGLSLLGSRR